MRCYERGDFPEGRGRKTQMAVPQPLAKIKYQKLHENENWTETGRRYLASAIAS